MCTLCKEYVATALDYLSKNKTQKEIIELLRISCTQLGAFKPEVIYPPTQISCLKSAAATESKKRKDTDVGVFLIVAQCVAFVDHYAPLLFSEISSIEPDDFCKKVSLCKEVIVTSSQIEEDGCESSQNAVPELSVS